MTLHTHTLSHEYGDGPSGPARSYWDIRRNGRSVYTLCLHTVAHGAEREAAGICHALDAAYNDGRDAAVADVRRALGIDT